MVKIFFYLFKNNIYFFILSFYFLFKKQINKNLNCIYPDRWELYEDNAFFMFKYCEENNKNIKIVCFKNEKNEKLLKKYNISNDNVIWFGSFKFVYNSFFLNNAFYSHSYHHCFPTFLKFKKLKANHYIFISHGIHFLKNHSKKDAKNTFEKSEILLKNIENYDDLYKTETQKKIVKTCLFNDYYLKKNKMNNGKIIYMPTWEKIKTRKFYDSEIYKQIEFLKRLNIEFDVLAHRYIEKKIEKFFKKNKLEINFAKCSQYEAIRDYSVCYTNNSSVAMDFLFLDKKVFLVNAFSKKNRFSKYRQFFCNIDIEELKGIKYIDELNISSIIYQ